MTKRLCFACLALALALSACSSGAPTSSDGSASAPVATPTTAEPTVAPTATAAATTAIEASPTAPPTPSPQPTATPPATPTAAAVAADACGNRYLPVAEGASWQYRLSGISSGTFTRRITAVRPDGFDDQDTFDAGTTRTSSWACRNGDLIALTPSGGATVAAADMQADFTVESNEGISLPADPQPGQTWTQKIVYSGRQTVGDVTMESRNVAETSCRAVGIEAVAVPAGTFEALRVNCKTTVQISLSGGPAGMPGFTFEGDDARWYAPGVGLIKSSGSTNMGATEIVLLAYNVP
ncbi:MAG: hypothetical protein NZM18_05680 [Thermoflexales bacterium]|nr:hypothetical protein [Thermoflexales bacterium]MDW8350936.1 hypothetical protein [Anaerolineae bacterium]